MTRLQLKCFWYVDDDILRTVPHLLRSFIWPVINRDLMRLCWADQGVGAVVSATGGLNTHRFNRRIIISSHSRASNLKHLLLSIMEHTFSSCIGVYWRRLMLIRWTWLIPDEHIKASLYTALYSKVSVLWEILGNCINNRNDEEAVARRRKNGWICGSPRRTRGPGLWRVLEGGKQFMAPRLVAIRCSPKHGWPGWLEEVVQRFIYCHAGIHFELVYIHKVRNTL